MKKVGAFQTEDGSLFVDANAAHDHEIITAVKKITTDAGEQIAAFIVENKDKLLAILEKPKL